jgi:hypothetical protein
LSKCPQCGFKRALPEPVRNLTREARDAKILEMRKQGAKHEYLALTFGLTQERIGQIIRGKHA